MNDCSKEHFKVVLQEIFDQTFSGKGEQRHGHGSNFEDQPWKYITDNVGTGFVTGQAMKKLMELRSFKVAEDASAEDKKRAYLAWKREALGVATYVIMGIMYEDSINDQV